MEGKASKLDGIFKRYHTARSNWYNRGIDNEELVYGDREGTGTQYSKSQLRKSKEEQTIPLTVNILSAIKEQIQAFLTAFKPSMTAIPVGKSTKQTAYVWKEICNCLWYTNTVSRELDAVIGDALTVGNGYLRTRPSHFYVSNEFNTIIEYVPWQYVYLDPDSKRQDLKDHEYIVLSIPYTASKAKKMYNLSDDEVKVACEVTNDTVTIPMNDSSVFEGKDDKLVWLQEFYSKEKHTVYILEDGRRVLEKPQNENHFVDEKGNLASNKVVTSHPQIYVRHTLKIGSLIKSDTLLACSEYPIMKIGCKWNKKPYDYPIVHDIVDLQKAFNSFLAITIVNAQVASNGGFIGVEGSVDKAKWKKDISTPGGFAGYDADPTLPNGGKPEQRIAQPLNNAWYTLMMQIIKFIEYVTGIYGVIQGNPNEAPATLGATNSLQDLGTQRIKRQARHIDYSLQDLFNVVIEYVQHYGEQDAIAAYVNNTDASIQIRTNVEGTIDEQGQFQEQTAGQEKANIIENLVTGEIKTIIGDYRTGQYKVHFQNSSDLPSTRLMALSIVKDLMAHMSDPRIATIVAEQAFELLDIPQADMILQKVDIVNNMEQQIQSLTEKVTELAKNNKKLEEEIFDREKEIKLLELDKDLNKTKVKLEALTKEQEDEVKEIEKQEKKQTIYN